MSATSTSEASKTRYNAVAIALHWITALLVIFMIVFGEELMEAGEELQEPGEAGEAFAGTFLPSLHVSIGVAILVLTVLRVVWRLMYKAPPLPDSMKTWEIIASKVTHAALYGLLIATPLLGWLAFGDFVAEEPGMGAVSVFGLFPLPSLGNFGETPKELHEIGSNAMMILAGIHVLAALKHQFLDGDGVFRRMLPI